MALRTAPIDHEAKLTLVEHLDELRGRIILCLVALVVVFSVCFWQADNLLSFINRPLVEAQKIEDGRPGPDPIQQNAFFDRQLADAVEVTAPALEQLSRSLERLAASGRFNEQERRELEQPADGLAAAAAKLSEAAAAVPRNTERKPVTLGVAEPFMTTMTVAAYTAILLTLPLILYQAYAFILPAFSPKEREVALPLMLAVPGLFIAGVVFAFFVVLPGAVGFLQNFNAENFDIMIQAKAYYQFSVVMMAGIGLLFQIPVAVLAVTRLHILTPAQLRQNRPYYVLGVALLAAIGNGSPDPFTMIFVMIPLIALFEISVRLASWLERRDRARDLEAEADGPGDGPG